MTHKSYEVIKDPKSGVEVVLKKEQEVGMVMPPGTLRFVPADEEFFVIDNKSYNSLLARIEKLEADAKLPLELRLKQARDGINILSNFVNEIQVDIDKERGLDGPVK